MFLLLEEDLLKIQKCTMKALKLLVVKTPSEIVRFAAIVWTILYFD